MTGTYGICCNQHLIILIKKKNTKNLTGTSEEINAHSLHLYSYKQYEFVLVMQIETKKCIFVIINMDMMLTLWHTFGSHAIPLCRIFEEGYGYFQISL